MSRSIRPSCALPHCALPTKVTQFGAMHESCQRTGMARLKIPRNGSLLKSLSTPLNTSAPTTLCCLGDLQFLSFEAARRMQPVLC